MIYTLTLNPSLDYKVDIEEIRVGKTNRSRSEELYVGGKGINVSLLLNELSIKSKALGFTAGFTGDEIIRRLDTKGIKNDFIKLKNGVSRINLKISSNQETEINAKGPNIKVDEIKDLMNKLYHIQDMTYLVLSGNIPESLGDDFYEIIIKLVKSRNNNVKFIVDTTGSSLINTLKYKPYLVKPNLAELEEIFECKIDREDILYYAKKLQDLGAENVIVSLGAQGAILINKKGNVFNEPGLSGKVIDTVGAGDSMVAGFIAGKQMKLSDEMSFKLALASASATAFSSSIGDYITINKLFRKIGGKYEN